MRWLLSLIFVMVTLSSAFATETKTEYITEEVCHAVAGCWVDTKTGECPDCVTETRKVVTVVETEENNITTEENYVSVKLDLIKIEMPTKKKIIEGCIELVAEKPLPCNWRSRLSVAINNADKECGLENWKWTNRAERIYTCNKG